MKSLEEGCKKPLVMLLINKDEQKWGQGKRRIVFIQLMSR